MAENTIFICYRREDAQGYAGRLYDRLATRFGEKKVFLDVDHIILGDDFVEAIERAVGSCKVLLAMIGPDWLTSTDDKNRLRLDNPKDYVRLEIGAALSHGVPVIPVLVNDARMPSEEELPKDLGDLSYRQALKLGEGYRWKADTDYLITTLDKIFGESQSESTASPSVLEKLKSSDTALPATEPNPSINASENAGEIHPADILPHPVPSPWWRGRGGQTRTAMIVIGVLLVAVLAYKVVPKIFPSADSATETMKANSNFSSPSPAATLASAANKETKDTASQLVPDGMTKIPGGDFMMGRNDGDDAYEKPAHRAIVKPFLIDVYEVTRDNYRTFVQMTKHASPLGWTNDEYPAGTGKQPVTGVNWDDANAYASWAGKRLPTEAEWEFAARSADGRRYPWGNQWNPLMANANGTTKGIANVGEYHGASPFGAFDMVGNVWEWTVTDLSAYTGGKLTPAPPAGAKVVRGGNYSSSKDHGATTTYRLGLLPTGDPSQYASTGFRCVKDIDGTAK